MASKGQEPFTLTAFLMQATSAFEEKLEGLPGRLPALLLLERSGTSYVREAADAPRAQGGRSEQDRQPEKSHTDGDWDEHFKRLSSEVSHTAKDLEGHTTL